MITVDVNTIQLDSGRTLEVPDGVFGLGLGHGGPVIYGGGMKVIVDLRSGQPRRLTTPEIRDIVQAMVRQWTDVLNSLKE